MKTKTSTASLNTDLILSDTHDNQVRFVSPTMMLKRQGSELVSCSLIGEVDLETYQQIEDQALFNLQPDLKGPNSDGPFSARRPITIKMVLHPILMERLTPYVKQIQAAVDYVLGLSQQPVVDPLLKAESWFITTFQQQQAKATVGYQTFWHFVEIHTLKDGLLTKDFLSGTMAFIRQKTNLDLSALEADVQSQWSVWEAFSQANLNPESDEIRQHLEALFQKDFATGVQSTTEGMDALVRTDEETAESPLFSVVRCFFVEADWDILRYPDSLTLELKTRGSQSEWSCLAQVDDIQDQFLFYSFCPVTVPAECRPKLAEFCVRANLGMVLGNFELDFDTGTLRYKTSVDVEGSYLEPAMIRQLVQANLETMDHYWPAIMKAIYGDVSSIAALSAVE
ncbi:MAG: YbjN domain-containing protein [Cyanobacteria bacterium P01_D01_bin.44]